ncbi:MAG: enoyl-CoA hydratase/isomerase family protein [Dehalococcoidia bacterium]|nr:enoyl-CoA hydratase/isomerase family protein [Dehalococcoidia bacterium]
MGHQFILTETRDRVGIITFNRPERLNAYTWEMAGEYRSQVEAWNADPGIGAIVLTGAGRSFCAGADIGGFAQQIQQREAGEATRERPRQEESWTEFVMHSKPVICAINGPAIGVGLTLALPCDVRIASEQARLSMRFVRIGVIPELGSTQLLPHIVGMGQALELMLSGRIIDAAEAGRIGLVNRVVPAEELMPTALSIAAEIASGPAENLVAIKRLTWQNYLNGTIAEASARENVEFGAAQARPAFKEAVTAFREKRQPNFNP